MARPVEFQVLPVKQETNLKWSSLIRFSEKPWDLATPSARYFDTGRRGNESERSRPTRRPLLYDIRNKNRSLIWKRVVRRRSGIVSIGEDVQPARFTASQKSTKIQKKKGLSFSLDPLFQVKGKFKSRPWLTSFDRAGFQISRLTSLQEYVTLNSLLHRSL